MRVSAVAAWVLAAVLVLGGAMARAQEKNISSNAPNEAAAQFSDNSICLGCHGNEGFGAPGPDGKPRSLSLNADKFQASVHGKRLCVECHKDITEIPHQPDTVRKVGCVQCHESLQDAAQSQNGNGNGNGNGKNGAHRNGNGKEAANVSRLDVVVDQIERYMNSVHARPNREDQSRTNATCYNCHDAHYVFPKGSAGREEWRMNLPNTCGSCHTPIRNEYAKSVHGQQVLEKGNPKAAICSDCHTTHDIDSPAKDSMKLVISENCGNCHASNRSTYKETYHGQVNTLGYAYTAKCFDCHGSHSIRRVNDPASRMYPDNRLETCRGCHKDATAGFATFDPHANTHDLQRYPYMWITSKFMILLLAGVFAFFWTHSALWFYREYKDRQAKTNRPHVKIDELPHAAGPHVRRWPWGWRLLHLVFALATMTLVLTGMSVFYAQSAWAPVVINAIGGPQVAAVIHRIAATVFVSIFFGQLIYLVIHLGRQWRTFDWFGPHSLVPGPQDLKDARAMFRWFFGQGPRPIFDRFTYWEKFDYWAPFWGVAIIGMSGLMLWMKSVTASFLPGWVFNVATLFHGEEAFLAAVFLFTVHFFNNHVRPDKFPLDIEMFTGVMPLEEYKREHTIEYNRLVAAGQFDKYIVQAPSRPITIGSKILGFTLLFIGFALLVMVLTGFVTTVMA